MAAKGDPPVCDHGIPRRWFEQPGLYGFKGWFCAAEVPDEQMCLPIFVGPAYAYTGGRARRRLRLRRRR